MLTKRLIAAVVALAATGAIAVACGSSDAETQAGCAPDDVTCNGSNLDDGSVPAVEVGAGGMYPPGSTVLPDGAVLLPDGNVVSPGGAITGCVPGSTACTNCKDDDGDGLIDWLDPECTGPLDNDENSFATGIPGDNIDACKQDCWFDGNSGSGNDGCLFPTKCIKGSTEPKCPYDEKAASDPKQCPPPSKACIEYCKPLTPKGCDCAGCCDVYDPTGKLFTVKLVGACTYESLGDATKCPACTKIPECSNPCGKCDFCLGKLTLPDECYPPKTDAGVDAPPPDAPVEPPGECPAGITKCSPTSPCPSGQYCLTGCCITPPK